MSTQVAYFNRELSWIEFNQRVLNEALKPEKQLLERLKFIAIVSSNLDEFFMVRVASLKRQFRDGNYITCPSGMSPSKQLREIRARVREMVNLQYKCLTEEILPGLRKQGIAYVNPEQYSDLQHQYLRSIFRSEVFPLLTPVRFDPNEAYINFSNLRLHVAFKLTKKENLAGQENDETERVAIVQMPTALNRIVYLPGERDVLSFSFLEHVIVRFAADLFPGYEIKEHLVFRLVRDADFSVEETNDSGFVEAMEEVLHNRDRSSVVRMTAGQTSPSLLKAIQTNLALEDSEVFVLPDPLDASVFMDIAMSPGYDNLRQEAWKPIENQIFLESSSVWEAIRQQDIMLTMPYESFAPVVRMVREASEDPRVLAIKMTLYRTSGDSPIVKALETAARNGKHVTVMVEIKARFDEQRNIAWAERLSQAGGIVIYGIVGLKVHAKALMVVRKEEDGIRRYLHLSTGNYNDRTARIYSDICIFTCREDFTYEAGLFFNAITGYSAIPAMNKLIMAPYSLKSRLLQMIDREIEKNSAESPGAIVAKMNALVDVDMIEALYRASQAGVKVSLNIRGICMLVPGLAGLSDNIKVFSIIDRYLEHARIVWFQNGGSDELYLSSADWMPRNLEGRVELMFPVEDPVLRARVKANLDIYTQDNCQAWELKPDGTWLSSRASKAAKQCSAQDVLYRLEAERNSRKNHPDKKEFSVRRKPLSE